jgi:hypothetical protein
MTPQENQARLAFLIDMVNKDLAQNKLVPIIASSIIRYCDYYVAQGMSEIDISTVLLELSKVYQGSPDLRLAIDRLASSYAAQAISHAMQNLAIASSSFAVSPGRNPLCLCCAMQNPTIASSLSAVHSPHVPSNLWQSQLSAEPLETKEQFRDFLSSFVQEQLSDFPAVDYEKIDAVSDRAACLVKEGTGLSGRNPTLVSGMAKLAFYDFIFLCGM